jgi:predicted HicB family RNase H-like nuclease
MNNEHLQIRIDPETKSKAVASAKKDGRSLSSWIRQLITKEVAK